MLAYTDALVYDGGRVADDVFAALQPHLSDEEILELTYITDALRDARDDDAARCGSSSTTATSPSWR